MARRPIIAGNWKMNTDPESAFELMSDMLDDLDAIEGVDVAICPPFVSLETLADMFDGTTLFLGAQTMFYKEHGAYTGEISPIMLKGMCDFVILGHSERRMYFHESDEDVRLRVKAAYEHDIMPILCVGENEEQNQAGHTLDVVRREVTVALQGIDSPRLAEGVIAYEPIWAIGTGRPCPAELANETIGEIRRIVAELHGGDVARRMRVQYGGSVNSRNIGEFVAQPEIDGALVGGASLDPEEFVRIVAITNDIKRRIS